MSNARQSVRSCIAANWLRLAVWAFFLGGVLAAPAAWGGEYRGNTRSKIYHDPGCRHYFCKNCTQVFETREEAEELGYRHCKVCLLWKRGEMPNPL